MVVSAGTVPLLTTSFKDLPNSSVFSTSLIGNLSMGSVPIATESIPIGAVGTGAVWLVSVTGFSREVREDRKVSSIESLTSELTAFVVVSPGMETFPVGTAAGFSITIGVAGDTMGTGSVGAAGTLPFVAEETMGTGPVIGSSREVRNDHKVSPTESFAFTRLGFVGVLGVMGTVPVGAPVGAAGTDSFVAG